MEDFLQEDTDIFSFDIIKSVFNHPWLLVYPIIIIMSLVIGLVLNSPSTYRCEAIISFTTPGREITKAGTGVLRRDVLLTQVLVGESMRKIIQEAFPQVKEERNEVQYNNVAKNLRRRISIRTGKGELLNISYIDQDPRRAYKTVKATVTAIGKEIDVANKKELETGLSYLRRQTKFYSEKLKNLDKKIEEVEIRIETQEQITPGTGEDITSIIINLQQKIVEESRRNEELQEQTKKDGVYLLGPETEKDPVIAGYSKSLDEKERALAKLISEGYKQAHPHVNKLRGEIGNLKTLKQKRLEELFRVMNEEQKEIARENLVFELQRSTFELETMKEQLSVLEQQKKELEKAGEGEGYELLGEKGILEQRAQLRELEQEYAVITRSYNKILAETALAETKLRQQIDEEIGLSIQIVQKPIVPRNPIPRKLFPKFLMGIIMALSAGVGLSLGANVLDTSVKSSVELRDLLKLPVLASIDTIKTPEEARTTNMRRMILVIILLIFIIVSQIFIRMVM